MTDHSEPVCFRCQLSLGRSSYTYREGRPIHSDCLRPEDLEGGPVPVYVGPPPGLTLGPAPGLTGKALEETNRVIHAAGMASWGKSLRDERAAGFKALADQLQDPGPGLAVPEPEGEPVPLAPPEEGPAYREARSREAVVDETLASQEYVTATGIRLDSLGRSVGLGRWRGETDTEYRNRIRALVHDGGGVKADGGKARWSLVPWEAMGPIVEVLTYGARKYAPDNWRKVPDARTRYTDALFRHLTAWASGEALDPESGLSHLGHAGCCLLFLLAFETEAHGRG